MTTPVSRKRGASDNEETPGFFSRLFSSVKKPRTVESSIISTRTTPLRPRRVNLTPPSMASPEVQNNNDQTFLNGDVDRTNSNDVMPRPRTNNNVSTSTALQPPSLALNLGIRDPDPSRMTMRRRRTRFRPESRTLLARKKQRQSASKDWNSKSLDLLLEQNKTLFPQSTDDSKSSFNTTQLRAVVSVTRKLGTNQDGSRVPLAQNPSQRVSFEEKEPPKKKGVSFNQMQTPVNTNRPARVKRQQTPGFPSTAAQSMTPVPAETVTSPASFDTTSPAATEPAVTLKLNLDGPFVFDGEDTMPPSGTEDIIIDDTFVSWDTQTPVIPEDISFDFTLPGRFKRNKTVTPAEDVTVNKGAEESSETPNTQETKKLKSTWGANMFKHSAGKWKCSVCSVMNPQTVSECVSCESKRENGGESTDTKSTVSKEASSGKQFHKEPAISASIPTPAKGIPFSFGSSPAPSSGVPFQFGQSSTSTSKASTSAAVGFSFGVKTSSEKSTAESSSTTNSEYPFGIPPKKASPSKSESSTKEADKNAGFQFGTTNTVSKISSPKLGVTSETKKESEAKAVGFTFGAPTGNLPIPNTEEKGKTGFGGFSFGAGSSSTKASNTSTPSVFAVKQGQNEVSQPEAKPAKNVRFGETGDSNGGENTRKKRRNDDNEEASTVSASTPAGSLFGGVTSTQNVDNKVKDSSAGKATFTFGSTPGASTSSSSIKSNSTPSTGPSFTFGSTTPAAKGTDDTKKDAEPVKTPGPSFTFGSTTPATTATAGATATEVEKDKAAQAPMFTFGKTTPATAGKKDDKSEKTPGPAFTFGSTTPATDANKSLQTPSAAPFSFGSTTPAMTGAADTNKESKPAQASAAAPFSFGSTTPATTAPSQPSFGGAAAPTSGASTTFGAAPVAAPAPLAGTKPANAFGATAPPAAVPASGFGSTSTQPFNSVQAQAPNGTPGFGSSASNSGSSTAFGSASAGTTSFGSAPAPAGFGSTPSQSFGKTPAPAAPAFGSSTPSTGFGAPATTPSNNVSFGQTPQGQGTFGSAAPSSTATPSANGFGASSFGAAPAAPAANAFGAASMTTPNTMGGGFNIGAGGSKSTGRGRRIVRAKRPPGSARR